MVRSEIKLMVDTKAVDRLAIGGRIYDMLDSENIDNRLKTVETDNGSLTLGINESDIMEMLNLVNPYRNSCKLEFAIIKD